MKKNEHNGPCVIFLHIPKAGGTTLHRVIERQYPFRQVFTVDSPGEERWIRKLETMSVSRRRELRVVKGHFPFGIHTYLPQRCEYITFVRDPVRRIVSMYQYIQRQPLHYLYRKVVGKMTLDEFARSDLTSEIENGQTRLIAGVGDTADRGPIGIMDRSHLDMAKKNLDELFGFAGVTSQFDASLVLLKRRYGWKDVKYRSRNISRSQTGSGLTDATKQYVLDRNSLDAELVEYVSKRFAELLRNQDSRFEEEVGELSGFRPTLFWSVTERLRQRPRRYFEWVRVYVLKAIKRKW